MPRKRDVNLSHCGNAIIDSAIKGIDGIWEGRAPSRPFYMAATERGPPNVSTPFVAESMIAVSFCCMAIVTLPLLQKEEHVIGSF